MRSTATNPRRCPTSRLAVLLASCAILAFALAPVRSSAASLSCLGSSDAVIDIFGVPFNKAKVEDIKKIYHGNWRIDPSPTDDRFKNTAGLAVTGADNTDADNVSISYIALKDDHELDGRVFSILYLYTSEGGDPALSKKAIEILDTLKAKYGAPCDTSEMNIPNYKSKDVSFGNNISVHFSYSSGTKLSQLSVQFWNENIFGQLKPGGKRLRDSVRNGSPF
jgi:hypothetical protein